MVRYVGGADRAVRILAGLALLSLVVVLEGGLRWFSLVGILPLATALFRTCPAYSVLGLSSCPARVAKK